MIQNSISGDTTIMGLITFGLGLTTRTAAPAPGRSPSDRAILGMNGPVKRALDLAIVVPAILFLAPFFLVIALAIKLEGGTVFYTQRRLGRGGESFSMIKFRSMKPDSDGLIEELLARCPIAAAEWSEFQKLRNDPRITRLGRFLRRSSIDELPQLFNVLFGTMSIVGQRPILASQRDAFGLHIAGYERARPGITGLWQVRGRNKLSFAQRAQMGSEYVNRWSIWFDIKIIAMTIPAVLFSKDAF